MRTCVTHHHACDCREEKFEKLREALGWFVNDPRFQVGVGGNPNVVEAMILEAQTRYREAA